MKKKIMNKDTSFVVGVNSVLELLKNKSDVNYIMCSSNLPKSISSLAYKKKIPIKYCDVKKLDSMFNKVNHQGIAAQISSRKYVDISDIINFAKSKNEKPFIIVLDKIQDPHNFGAIARTAECMGVHGIIIGKRRCVSITPAVEKCSCGALEHILVARVDSISKSCEILKDNNIWICGTDMDGEPINKISNLFTEGIALIVGSEGYGISENVRKKCDIVTSIPMFGKINSLNASVASAIFMYKISEKRNK